MFHVCVTNYHVIYDVLNVLILIKYFNDKGSCAKISQYYRGDYLMSVILERDPILNRYIMYQSFIFGAYEKYYVLRLVIRQSRNIKDQNPKISIEFAYLIKEIHPKPQNI